MDPLGLDPGIGPVIPQLSSLIHFRGDLQLFLGSSSKMLPVCPIAENEALQSAAAGSLFTWDCGINPS